jgi:hypothetical protein
LPIPSLFWWAARGRKSWPPNTEDTEKRWGSALDKQTAEKVFNECDTSQSGYLTEEELTEPQKQRMIQEVIRLTEPGR